jgi:hypothetical protein
MEYQVLVTFISQVRSFTNVIVHFIAVQFLTKAKYSLPTVHDRRLGYSNSLKTSAEGIYFTHTIRLLLVWASSLHSDVYHDKQTIINVLFARLSINTTAKRCVPQH